MKKKFLVSGIAIAVLLACTVACVSQSQLSALAAVVSTSLSNLANIDPPNESAYSKAAGFMSKVSADIAQWKKGKPSDEIVQGVNDAVAALDSIVKVSQQTKELIVWAEAAMQSIVAIVQPSNGQTVVKVVSVKQYKAHWNALAPPGAQLE